MFIDSAKITVEAGKGGNGIIAFKHEKYIELGGPFGGTGGDGGDILFEVDNGLRTLMDFSYGKIIKAKPGENGKNKCKHGKNSEPLILKVPPGTVVYNDDTDELICDLIVGEPKVIAKGGRGGRGNYALAKAGKHSLEICENGEPGQIINLRLELKLLADVGLVGMPSVGKSTLISVVSNVKPKIAPYHFTTLKPNLGVAKYEGGSFAIADLPGLIEGASLGKGLGMQFLKHIERTRLILHVIDMGSFEQRSPIKDYEVVNKELENYGLGLEVRPQIIVANKMDLPDADKNLLEFKEKYPCEKVIEISSLTKQGIQQLKEQVGLKLDEIGNEFVVNEKIERKVYKFNADSGIRIYRDDHEIVHVTGEEVEKLVAMSNLNTHDNVMRFIENLKKLGVYEELEKLGIENGETVIIGGFEFEYEI